MSQDTQDHIAKSDTTEQMHAERRAALYSSEVAQLRAWARRWVPDSLLESMYAARLRDETIPAELRYASAVVLAAKGDK